MKIRLKVVSTGVEQLLQLFTAPASRENLLVLASSLDTTKQAPWAKDLTRSRRAKQPPLVRQRGSAGTPAPRPGWERCQFSRRQPVAGAAGAGRSSHDQGS